MDGFVKSLPKALKYTQMAAEKGYARAQTQLASMYEKGRGVPQNWEKSFYWFLQAANQDHAPAQYNIGYAYYLGGRGIAKDIDQAFIWYKKSADQGYEATQCNVGKNESLC
jgi:TPR repeat protein